MRLFEIEQPLDPEDMIGAEPEITAQQPVKPGIQTKPTNSPEVEPTYASKDDLTILTNQLNSEFAKQGINANVKYSKKSGRLPVLRISDVTPQEINTTMQSLGYTPADVTERQSISSGQFSIYSYELNNVSYTIVLLGSKKSKAYQADGVDSDLILNRKDLTPAKLGIAGKTFSDKDQLEQATRTALKSRIRNPKLLAALNEIIDIAVNGGQGQISPDNLVYIKAHLGMISQDLGEILTPLVLAKPEDNIEFPAGNEKLIDVTIGNLRYSVKALGGSGTSMNSLGDLLDEYELTLTDEGKKKLFNDGIKIWRSTRKEGSVADRICLAGFRNKTPEYLTYAAILGGDFDSFAKLKSLLSAKTTDLSYPEFLKLVYPAMTAGNWDKPAGLPDDGRYYLGFTDKKPEPGIAGKYSYDHDPVNGAANICTYSVGVGILNLISRGPNAQQYKDIMTDMVRNLNCILGHVTLTQAGELKITQTPFSSLDFEFDYHAPSNIAGNNRPGFLIVPPNKRKSKKLTKK